MDPAHKRSRKTQGNNNTTRQTNLRHHKSSYLFPKIQFHPTSLDNGINNFCSNVSMSFLLLEANNITVVPNLINCFSKRACQNHCSTSLTIALFKDPV